MPTIYGPLDIVKNELRNAVIQNLGTAPAAPVKGLIYFNSADNTLYWYDGTAWIPSKAGAAATPASTVTTAAIGDAPVVGVGTAYARDDHKHGMPAFGTPTAQTAFGAASGAGAAATLPRSDHTHGTPTHDNAAHAAISRSALAVPTADVSMAGFKLTNLAGPVASTDAVNLQYLSTFLQGITWKNSCRCATTANVTLSGNQTLDGVATATGDRVLVKNQTNPAENGIYQTAVGAWPRAIDADAEPELLNAAVFIQAGTINADQAWVQTTNAPITVGTTALTWVQFGAATAYVAGLGLTLTGTTFDVGAGVGITVAADTIAVDQAVIASRSYVDTAVAAAARKFAAALTGTASPETVTHNLNTRDVHVAVYNGATPYTAVEIDWDAATVNAITVRYNPNLGAGYRVVVLG